MGFAHGRGNSYLSWSLGACHMCTRVCWWWDWKIVWLDKNFKFYYASYKKSSIGAFESFIGAFESFFGAFESFFGAFEILQILPIYTIIGTTAVSGSDDKTIIVWETARGLALTSLQLHVQFTRFDISLECSRILVHLTDNPSFPIICLHNSPAQYIKLPTYSAPARDVEGKFLVFHFDGLTFE